MQIHPPQEETWPKANPESISEYSGLNINTGGGAIKLPATLTLALAASGLQAQVPFQDDNSWFKGTVQPTSGNSEKKAEASLLELKAAKKLDNSHKFNKSSSSVDSQGKQHFRYQLTYQGIPVHGAGVIVHLDSEGNVEEPTLDRISPIQLASNQTLSTKEALEILGRELDLNLNPSQAIVEKVVFPKMIRVVHGNRAFQLNSEHPLVNLEDIEDKVDQYLPAFRVSLNPPLKSRTTDANQFILDGRYGTILEQWSNSASGTGNSQYSGSVPLSSTLSGGLHYLTGNGFSLNDARNRVYASGNAQPGWPFFDTDNIWGDGADYSTANATSSANGQTAVVDAKYGLDNTRQFFSTIFGRTGGNGVGSSGTIQAFAHVDFGDAQARADWWYDPWTLNWLYRVSFGNGDYRSFSPTSLDIVAHEWTHLITFENIHLSGINGETGGIHEGFSDIFSAAFKAWMQNGRSTTIGNAGSISTWQFGLIGRDGRAMRCMYDPKNPFLAYQDSNSVNRVVWEPNIINEEIHGAAGPLNRCFYFLAEGFDAFGGTGPRSNFLPFGMTKIGMDKAIRIWYQAYNYMGDQSTYPTVYSATIRAAKDLYGFESPEYQAVENAFATINIGNGHGPIIDGSTAGTTPASAQVIPQGNISFITGYNPNPSDVDYYRFTLPPGQTLRLTLNHMNAGFPTSDLNLQIVTATGLVLAIKEAKAPRNFEGVMVDPGDESTDPKISEYNSGPATQTVYARVSSSSTNSRYRLIARNLIYPLY